MKTSDVKLKRLRQEQRISRECSQAEPEGSDLRAIFMEQYTAIEDSIKQLELERLLPGYQDSEYVSTRVHPPALPRKKKRCKRR